MSKAWLDVMSFAILVVVERTVESWTSSHGMSLTEVRIHGKPPIT